MIPPAKFAGFIATRSRLAARRSRDEALDAAPRASRRPPYGTQELAYFVWELVPAGGEATVEDIEEALTRVLRSEHNHFVQLWDDAPRPQRLL